MYFRSVLLYPNTISNQSILISPLDWGMGHTTRCLPIIHQLIRQNNIVHFAGNKKQLQFVQREFPELIYHYLEGYNVTLDSKKSTYLQLIKQLFTIKRAIKAEHKFVQKMVEKHHLNTIISDNRYGFYSNKTNNILLTHQLSLQLPRFKKMVNNRLLKMVENFNCCWIPDTENESLCGALSIANLQIPKLMIGHLCRFQPNKKTTTKFKYHFIGVVSGPEPERSRFAEQLLNYFKTKKVNCALVGLKGNHTEIDFYENPKTDELNQLINDSETIISRAGYTTIMEMTVLNKSCILIPTKGQYEQEYLSKNVKKENITFIDEAAFFV